MKKNVFSYLSGGELCLSGIRDRAVDFTLKEQLVREDVWKDFTDVFLLCADKEDNGWRGEYWGKMMRGASLVYTYRPDEKLYSVLENSARNMLKTARKSGSFTTYGEENEFGTWDIWCRKYVLTGFIHFLKICKDSALKAEILSALCSHADYITEKIGRREDGKKEIVKTSLKWLGVNSCSILEPFVELYKLTKEEKYLRFAEYIISTGGCDGGSLIKQIFEYNLPPYLLSENKAYETISFFEGILAYYEVTGKKKYFEITKKFADAVNRTDVTVIGCCGCRHEQFDNSAAVQAEKPAGIMQETCVTVTWMRFNSRLFMLTGDSKYLERFYLSAYNAMYGALNTHHEDGFDTLLKKRVHPLPFDSYSPLYKAPRGQGTGGKKSLPKIGFYGCCACIASAGVALVPLMGALKKKSGILITDFFTGNISARLENGAFVSLSSKTEMPEKAFCEIKITSDKPVSLEIFIPPFIKKLKLSQNGKSRNAEIKDGYITLKGKFSDDIITLSGSISLKKTKIGKMYSLSYGYITLAADEAKTQNFDKISLKGRLSSAFAPKNSRENEQLRFTFKDSAGKSFILTDYASCGKRWTKKKNRVSVWFD